MNIKVVPIPKKDVESLSEEELMILVEWKESEGFKLAQKLSDEFLVRRTKAEMELIEGSPFEEIGKRMSALAQIKVGVDYFLDSAQRAKEELEERNNKVKK